MYIPKKIFPKGSMNMQNKRILFTAPNVAEYLDCPMPEAKPGTVVVKLAISSISAGPERANITGNDTVSWVSAPKVSFPRTGGYSTTGVIIEVGEGVQGLAVGDRVAMSWTTHNRYVAVPQNNVYKLPDEVSFSAGALVHIGTFPMAAIRKTNFEFGESAIVMGCGVLGLIAVQLLRIAGAVPVIAVDPNPERRAQAMKFGADYALDPFADGFRETVKKLTNGGAKVAIEVTGNGPALDMVLDCMARFGRVALLGCTRSSEFTIDYYRKVHGPGITLVGAHTNARPVHESSEGWWTQRDDAEALIAFHRAGRLNFETMVEETYSPVEAPAVYTRLCNDKSFPITQFDWSRDPENV